MHQALSATIASGSNYISPSIIQDGAKGTKVYFGTGLASAREESQGFGFEMLSPALTALVTMKELRADGVLHEIGTVGYNISEEQHGRLIEEQINLIINMVENLGLESVYEVEFSHSYHDREEFKAIKSEVEDKMRVFRELPNYKRYGGYTLIQIAQMKYLHETENTSIKVGWIIGSKPSLGTIGEYEVEELINQGSLNEYFFDSLYRYVFPNDEYSFVYTAAGVDVYDGRRYAPYTVTQSQRRPLLVEPIKAYLGSVPDSRYKRIALRHYESTIVSNFEFLFGEIDTYDHITTDERLVTKLQYIQDRVLGVCVA